jgi:hypothetical protein
MLWGGLATGSGLATLSTRLSFGHGQAAPSNLSHADVVLSTLLEQQEEIGQRH